MQLLYSRDNWLFYYGPEPTINFCFWVLQVDGLHVPPFDQHPDGDGSLRALGLTAADWQSWFLRVINREQKKRDEQHLQRHALAEYLGISKDPSESDIQRLNQCFQAEYFNASASKDLSESDVQQLQRRVLAEHFNVAKEPPLPPFPESYHYHASWRGSDAVRSRLIELQEPYKQVYRQYDVLCSDIIRAIDKEERRSGTNLYDELKPYHTRIPRLANSFVGYEHPLDYLVPPATFIMTVQEGQPNPQEFRERVLAAAAELAARPGRRSILSPYTRIRENVGQFTVAYCHHTRKPAPPPPPEQEMPRLADPARQAVLDHLSERLFYGNVDFTTVQFLREKKRPSWKLYEVLFQEIDGEQHRMIFVFQQEEDGSWRFETGGDRIDMQNEWSRIHVPVRDHSLLFLSPEGPYFDNRTHLRTAYGDVIDNGFHVKQVRLVNDAGQILEDTVEDGYVFFACKIESRVQLPMQAELYDHQGKLVWQQTVALDGELPPWLK